MGLGCGDVPPWLRKKYWSLVPPAPKLELGFERAAAPGFPAFLRDADHLETVVGRGNVQPLAGRVFDLETGTIFRNFLQHALAAAEIGFENGSTPLIALPAKVHQFGCGDARDYDNHVVAL